MIFIKYILPITIIILAFKETKCSEDRYLRYIKDSCFLRGEAFSCVKYKALKIAKKTLFGDMNNNKTITANKIISFVPLDEETIANLTENDEVDLAPNESKGFLSEWTEIANYFMTLVKEFFKMRGLRVNLPEGARTVEDQEDVDGGCSVGVGQVHGRLNASNAEQTQVYNEEDVQNFSDFMKILGRGKKKKLAVMIPLLNLMATMKTKMMLIPILLGVMLIKKLLLIAALLLPSLLSTLKACKQHHPMTHYSYFGGGDSSDYNSEYSNSYTYGSGGAYGKDWPTNRAYSMPKQRTPSPVYITAPGTSA